MFHNHPPSYAVCQWSVGSAVLSRARQAPNHSEFGVLVACTLTAKIILSSTFTKYRRVPSIILIGKSILLIYDSYCLVH